jgi:predicted ATPase
VPDLSAPDLSVPDLSVPVVGRAEPVRTRTAVRVRGTVPTPLTGLVGRRTEIAELSSLLIDRRLLTLTGVGGCGKTRLAVAVAERLTERFADGVWFVDLAPLTDPSLVAGAVAAELERPTDLDGEDLVNHLRDKQSLLVLDNCEHVVQACAELATGLLRCCPGLRILATSREVLGVLGEVAWPVPALSAPPPSRSECGLAEVSRYDAVRLFLDRANVAAVRGFADDDAPGIAALCARLDGLPLAIELAAARTAVLTVAEITGRLHDPTLLRTSRQPDRPHHRAMHTTIAWSYDLLDPLAQDRFRRLAVFAGGFTLAAADGVWPSGPAAIDVLADLVAKSLVVVERTMSGARYRLLETIGRWAAARLADSPGAERDARARHAAHYLELAEEADRHLRGTEAGDWLTRLAAEHENLRSALAWFAEADPVARIRLAVALNQYCHLRGRYAEGRRWIERALVGVASAPADLAGKAFKATACFALLTCDYDDAERFGEQALNAQRAGDDQVAIAMTLRLLASVARERGDYRKALAMLGEALESLDGDPVAIMGVRHQFGFTRWLAGDLDGAERDLTASLRWHERADGGDPVSVASELIHLAMVALYRGRLDEADRLAGDAMARSVELDIKEGIAWSWNAIGLVELRRNRVTAAVSALRASLSVHCAIGDRWRQASVLDALAEAFVAGDPVRAAELSGLASAIRERLDVPVPAQERGDREHTQAVLRLALPPDQYRAATARGATLRLPDVLGGLPG